MNYRKLGNTGVVVSEIGFGAWGIGGRTEGATSYGETDDRESLEALRQAFDCGITFFDTACVYGHSESLIGQALRGVRDRVVIATKAGRNDYQSVGDYTGKNLRRSLEGSLRTLQTDYVDLLQLHSPPLSAVDEETVSTLEHLRDEGKIRTYGISAVSLEDAKTAIRDFAFPVVQINFNLVDQRAVDSGLLALAVQDQVGVIVRTPLCFGLLSGRVTPQTEFDPSDHRSAWSRAQIDRWIEGSRMFVTAVADRDQQTQAQVALRFCLSHHGVSTVIPGMLTSAEVAENAAASNFGSLSAAELAEISRIYASNTFFVPRK